MESGKRKKILIIFSIFCCICLYNFKNTYANSVEKEKEFIISGFKYNISLIKSAQLDFKVCDKMGQTKKEGKWFFKPGSERVDLIETADGQVTRVSYIYTDTKTYIIGYQADKIESVSLGLSVYYIQQEIRSALTPSFIFLHLWPVGATLEELVTQSTSYRLEIFEGSKCFKMEIPKFEKEFKGYGRANYPALSYKIWLSVEEGFLPKKIDIYMNQKKVMEIGPIIMNKFDNNIWFPKETKIIWFSGGEKKEEGYIEYSNIKINSEIENKVFTPVFPPGTKIIDYRTGTTFTISEK